MADIMADSAACYAFYRRTHHLGLKEEAWAALLSDLDCTKRQLWREHLQDLSDGLGELEPFRARMLVALDSLDSLELLEDPRPTRAVRSQARTLLARIAKG